MNLIILVFSALGNIILGSLVYSRNSHSASHRLFASLTVSLTLMLIANQFTIVSNSQAIDAPAILFWIRAAMFFAVPVSVFYLLFVITFPKTSIPLPRPLLLILIFASLLTMFVALSPFLFTHIQVSGSNVQPIPGPGIILFALTAVGSVIAGTVLLVRRVFIATGLERSQLRLILLGTALMFGLIVGTVFIPVNLLNFSGFAPYISLYTLTFVGATAYAIVRHHLLDIQIIIRRSLVYSALLTTLTLLYSIVVAVFNSVFSFDNQYFGLRLTDLVAIIVIAFTVEPLRRLIEKTTDRIFFKARYNAEETLENVSETLVSEIDLTHLVGDLKKVLQETIKVGKIALYVRGENGYSPIKTANDFPDELAVAIEKRLLISEHLENYSEVLVIEELKEAMKAGNVLDHPLANWVEIFSRNGIQVVVPLLVKKQLRGLMLLGEKLSQDAYSGEDIRFLEILSHQAALALENARLYEEQKLYNIHLKEEVEKATAELKVANEKLRELDKLKDEFISVTSHDLRTPLTAIKSYLWLTLHGKAGKLNEKMDFYLGRSYQSAERMLALISDLLDVSRIERGKIELNLEPADLGQVMEMVLDELDSKAMERSINLQLKLPKTKLPEVMLDQERFPEIITNLVGNALKFTPIKGRVTVSATQRKNMVEVSVTDTGVGIGKEDFPKLFSKFGRLDNSYKAIASSGGTGLGLYITKSLVQLHGGEIGVVSQLGKGTTFTFTLRVATTEEKKQKRYIPAPRGVIINPELMGAFKTNTKL